MKSGFCNPSWDRSTAMGAESHSRCRLPGCVCDCHRPPKRDLPSEYQAPVYSPKVAAALAEHEHVVAGQVGKIVHQFSAWRSRHRYCFVDDGRRLVCRRLPEPPPQMQASMGPFSIAEDRQVPTGFAVIGPPDTPLEQLVAWARDGDPRAQVIQGAIR